MALIGGIFGALIGFVVGILFVEVIFANNRVGSTSFRSRSQRWAGLSERRSCGVSQFEGARPVN
jgi:gas vesicle protein